MYAKRFALAVAAVLAASLLFAPTAAAHASSSTTDGKYRITWGLLDEPAFAQQKNRLDLIIVDNETRAGIGGLEATGLHLELKRGEEEYDLGDLAVYRGAKSGAFAGPGNYTASKHVFLTQPGIYVLHVRGTINGSEVDLEIPAAHAYESLSEISFPDEEAFPDADTSELEAQVAALTARVAALEAKASTQSSTPATVTGQTPAGSSDVPFGAMLVALGLVAAALLLRRRKA